MAWQAMHKTFTRLLQAFRQSLVKQHSGNIFGDLYVCLSHDRKRPNTQLMTA